MCAESGAWASAVEVLDNTADVPVLGCWGAAGRDCENAEIEGGKEDVAKSETVEVTACGGLNTVSEMACLTRFETMTG